MSDEHGPVSNDDYVSIQRLIGRYADAVMYRNRAQWASTWADDAVWALAPGRTVEGREAIVELWTNAMTGMAAVYHVPHFGELWYTDAGHDRAAGRSYVSESFERAGGDKMILLANYDDEFVRTSEGWRFARRELQRHYMGAPDLSGEFANTADGLRARGLSPEV